MRISDLIIATVALARVGVNASRHVRKDTPGFLKLDLQKRSPEAITASLKQRRGGVEIFEPDINYMKYLLYIVKLDIGTPAQATYVQLDTGSSDLTVETPTSNICSYPPPNPCTVFGAYNANSSSTYRYIDSNFHVAYAGGDGAIGDWVSDFVVFGRALMPNLQFGIQYQTTILEGILGVGYQAIESRQIISGEPEYDNFPTRLVQLGYISSRTFSLWTNDDRSDSGTLLFGAIDTTKFSSDLVKIDLLVSGFAGYQEVVDFTVSVCSVGGTDANGNSVVFTDGATPFNVLIDSGTTFTQFPNNLVQSIWTLVGATPYGGYPSLAYLPCSTRESSITISISFLGITIDVPISQLVVFPDDQKVYCTFGIGKGPGNQYIIGDTVLTAMYVVHDLDNNQISLAATIFNATESEFFQTINRGPSGAPGAIGPFSVCGSPQPPVSSSAVSTSAAVSSSSTIQSSSMDISSQSSATPTSSLISSVAISTIQSSSMDMSSQSSAAPTSSFISSVASSTIIFASSIASSTTIYSTSAVLSSESTILQSDSSVSTSTTTVYSPVLTSTNIEPSSSAITSSSSLFSEPFSSSSVTSTAPSSLVFSSSISSMLFSTLTASTSSLKSSLLSSTVTFSSSTLITSTTTPMISSVVPESPLKCNSNNCLRAIAKASASGFCSAYQAGVPVAVPTAIEKGCKTLSSRISSGCACYAPLTAGPQTTSIPSVAVSATLTSNSFATSQTSTIAAITPAVPLKCSKNNCLRAVQKLSPTDFCSAYITGAPTAVPTAIANGCETSASRVTSACQCLLRSG